MRDALLRYPAPVHDLDAVGSTNDLALSALGAGAVHGELFVAARQSDGRGRRGRRWWVPGGEQLAMSVVLRPAWPLQTLPQLTLAAGVAVAEAVEASWGVRLGLKWPNDLVDRASLRKVGGVLCESVLVGAHLQGVVVGVGMNLAGTASELPAELAEIATTLAALGASVAPGARYGLAVQCAERLLTWGTDPDVAVVTAAVRARWRERSVLPRPVTLADGCRGEAVDLGDDGALLVRVAGGLVRVESGELDWR